MYNNVGGKIKGIASFVTGIGIAISVCAGIVMIAVLEDLVFWGFLVMIVGSIASWLATLLLYGFGQLIENSDIIAKHLKNLDHKDSSSSNPVQQPDKSSTADTNKITVNTEGQRVGTCDFCGKEFVMLKKCAIKDEYGLRYRDLCEECINKIENGVSTV